MQDSFRLRVVKALASAIEEVRIANGYQFDLGDAVFRGRPVLDDNDPLPAVTILEKPILPEDLAVPGGNASARVDLELIVQGFAEDDRFHPTDPAYLLLADVQRRLVQEKLRDDGCDVLRFGGRVTDLNIGQGVVRPPDAVVSSTAFFWLPVTLTFGEYLDDPFA